MRSSTILSITVLATSAIAAPVAYSAVQDISAREAFPEASSYIIARDSTLERRQPAEPNWPSSSRVGTKTYKGNDDQLVAHIVMNQKAQPALNSATHDYIRETANKMEGVAKPDNLDQHASAEDAAKHLVKTNDPYASQVISHFQNTVNENNGASGQGTLLGNRPDSHIV